MDGLLLDHKYLSNPSLPEQHNPHLGPAAVVVPFVACGDLSGFDADKSYELDDSSYVYREPVQPPIHPNYYSYQKKFTWK